MSNIRSKSGSNKIELVILDLASLDSVRECAKKIQEKETKIDYLINNAGKCLNTIYMRIDQACTIPYLYFLWMYYLNFLG